MPRKAARWPVHEYRTGGGVVVHCGRVLLLRRPKKGEVRLPKGHIEPDESIEACALREVSEESGLQHPILVLLLGVTENRFAFRGSHVIRHEAWFLMAAPGPELGTHEPQWVPIWVPLVEAAGLLSFESERLALAWAEAAVRRGALAEHP